jgi:TPR repeat protein
MMAGAQNLLMTLWPVSDDFTPTFMADFYKEALTTKDAPGALAHVQRDWLVKLRKEKGLLAAVRDAGPFAMVVMANPNAKPSSSDTNKSTNAPTPDPRANIQPLVAPAPTVVQSKGGSVLEFQNALVKADAGDAYAQAVVAIYYCLGYKTDKNLDRASEYASKSATQGNPLGVYVLGSMIAQGNGVEKDPEKGVKLKMQATEGLKNMEIDPYALASLGAMALRGEGESKDMKKAASLYKQSADLGYAPAQIIYGVMLSKGVGIPKNSTKSNFYLQKAKEQNFTPPQQAQN